MHYTLLRVQLPFFTHKYYNSLLLLLFSSKSPDRLCTYYRTSSRLPDHIPSGLVVVGAPPYTLQSSRVKLDCEPCGARDDNNGSTYTHVILLCV